MFGAPILDFKKSWVYGTHGIHANEAPEFCNICTLVWYSIIHSKIISFLDTSNATKFLIVTGYAKGIKGGNEDYYSQSEFIDFSSQKCDSTWPTFPIKGGSHGAQGLLDVHNCIILCQPKQNET